MGASLTVEGAHDPARLAAQHPGRAAPDGADHAAGLRSCCSSARRWILGVFGAGYADAATPLLRWFAVGAVLRVVMETYFAVLRAQSRTSGLAWLQGLLCVLVLGLTLVLLPRMGLTGAGVAEISSLAVIVAIAAPKLYRVPGRAGRACPRRGPDGDLADLGARRAARAAPGAARPGAGRGHPRARHPPRLRPPGAAARRTPGPGTPPTRRRARGTRRTTGRPGR